MAKGVATPAPEGGYQVVYGKGPPEIVRRAGAATSPVAETMKTMPHCDWKQWYPDGSVKSLRTYVDGEIDGESWGWHANGQVAEFFVAVSVPDSITDPAERDKALKDEARKASNRLSGIARRVAKADASLNFALRTKVQDDKMGIVVYRIAPAPAKTKA